MKNFQIRRSFEVPDDLIEKLADGGYLAGYNYDGRYIWGGTEEYESEKVYFLFSFKSSGAAVLFIEGPYTSVERVSSFLIEKGFVSVLKYYQTKEDVC